MASLVLRKLWLRPGLRQWTVVIVIVFSMGRGWRIFASPWVLLPITCGTWSSGKA